MSTDKKVCYHKTLDVMVYFYNGKCFSVKTSNLIKFLSI